MRTDFVSSITPSKLKTYKRENELAPAPDQQKAKIENMSPFSDWNQSGILIPTT